MRFAGGAANITGGLGKRGNMRMVDANPWLTMWLTIPAHTGITVSGTQFRDLEKLLWVVAEKDGRMYAELL